AWDVSTADYDTKFKDVSDQDTNPYGVSFKPDGTKMYMVGYTNDTVYQYSLSPAWDVSTADYDTKFKDVGDQETNPRGVFFKPDGTKMYIMGGATATVYQYSLSTAWDVSTADYDTKLKDVGGQDTNTYGVFFKPDGTKMYIMGNTNDTVYQYSLSTAWDVSTADYDTKLKYVGTQDLTPTDVFFKPDGTKMYIVGNYYDTVHQYSLPVVAATVTTVAADNIGQTKANPKGNVTNTGGENPTRYIDYDIDSG
ncbi:unnamed protein product, partial [marine sediment metagenome]